MKITSLQNEKIKELVLLKKTAKRKEQGLFLVQGDDFLIPSLESGLAKEVFSLKEIDTKGVPLTLVDEKVLKRISLYEDSLSPIVLCKYPNRTIKKGKKMLYLEEVQDPGNVGSLIRTALAFSYDGVYLSSGSASLYSSKTLSSTKGSIFLIPCYEDVELKDLMDEQVEIIATSLKDAIDYKEVKPKNPFILILGNEGKGVKENTLKMAHKIVKIKMNPALDSLNVAIAGGILMERYQNE